MAIAAFVGVADAQTPKKVDSAKSDVSGPVVYTKDGVELAGRKFAWKELRSLEDVPRTREQLDAERDERTKRFETLLAADPKNAEARRELGWVTVDKEWRRTADVVAERRKALPSEPASSSDAEPKSGAKSSPKRGESSVTNSARIELAKFAAEHGDPDDAWRLLVEVACADPYDRAAIARLKPIVEKRPTTSVLAPPLVGTWRAEVDTTRHHQVKAFAFEAIDFRSVDDKGETFHDSGKKLEDYFGFDQVVRAAADGVVTQVEDGFSDLPPGVAGKYDEANYVTIEHVAPEGTDYGHLRQHSALVKVGDRVKAGQPIAHVGNSGASGLPHLHFTLEMPIEDELGKGEWIGLPWRLRGFRVVAANGSPCDFEVKRARVVEGWTMVFPSPR